MQIKINNWLDNEKRIFIIHVPQKCLGAIVLSVTLSEASWPESAASFP